MTPDQIKRAVEFNNKKGRPWYMGTEVFAQIVWLAQQQLGRDGFSLEIDGAFGPQTEEALKQRFNLVVLPARVDITSQSKRYEVYETGEPWIARTAAHITGICLHQTACYLGERPQRWATVNTHYGITRAGQEIRIHPETLIAPAANGWNNRTISIECDGLYAGIKGNLKTVWDDPTTPAREQPMTPTPELIATTKALIRRLKAAFPSIKYLVAHRQSSMDRQNDPGEEIWKAVALPMMTELGLEDGGAGFAIGGYPIPEIWDPAKKGIKY